MGGMRLDRMPQTPALSHGSGGSDSETPGRFGVEARARRLIRRTSSRQTQTGGLRAVATVLAVRSSSRPPPQLTTTRDLGAAGSPLPVFCVHVVVKEQGEARQSSRGAYRVTRALAPRAAFHNHMTLDFPQATSRSTPTPTRFVDALRTPSRTR